MDGNAKKLWEASETAVKSGRENEVIDLKFKWYDLDDDLGKLKLLKHICAMANPLTNRADAECGYIIFGVLDAKDRARDANAADYVTGVQSCAVNERNERIGQLVHTYVDPYVNVRYSELRHPDVDAILGVLEIWGCWVDRPYVIKKGIVVKKATGIKEEIHKLSEGQVYVRLSAGISILASQVHIRQLVRYSQERQIEALEKEIGDLEDKYRDDLNNAEMRMDQKYGERLAALQQEIADAEKRLAALQQEIADVKQDHRDSMTLLRNDKAGAAEERERLKELARGLLRHFWARSEDDRSILRRCFGHYDMEDYMEDWIDEGLVSQ